jgi:transglutaminase-like putative cysteine protease
MSRTAFAGVFSVMLVISIVMGAYSTLSMPSANGFAKQDLRAPGDYTPPTLPTAPTNVAGDTTARPNINIRILVGQIFERYGGSIRIIAHNNDTRALFLEEVMFEWVGTGLSSSITTNRRIEPGEKYEIMALAVSGPPVSGARDYILSVRLLQYRNNAWYRMVSGGDDWVSFSEQTIDVQSLADTEENAVSYNPLRYYTRVNELVDFSSTDVENATQPILSGTGYNIGKVCAIFDWLVTNINYTEDPGGGDVWYSPDETLAMMAGDCEDYAMLLAAMVNLAGGNSRVYLTHDHAFAAVYVGNETGNLQNVTADIRAYYNTQVPVHAFRDETGYWMVADPLGSFYMGGLAVGQVPMEQENQYWTSAFPESGTLYSIDVTGTFIEQPLWLDPLFWIGMILVFGALALGFMVSAYSVEQPSIQNCLACAGDVGEDIYVCPHCQAAYHRACAFSGANCGQCQKPILFPPPPEIK